MRFLADEQFPRSSIRLLRGAGHEVVAIAEVAAGADDPAVLAQAVADGQIILTFDRDYGDLVFRLKLPPPSGIVYFRVVIVRPSLPAERLLSLLVTPGIPLLGRFTVIDEAGFRQRSFLR